MSAETIKLELMLWIGELTDKGLLTQLHGLKKKFEATAPLARKPGWGKEVFLYVAPDFDETPEGFEEYVPAA